MFEVFDECCDGLVDLVGHAAVALFDLSVLVPGVGGAACTDADREAGKFDEAYAFFDEFAGEETLAGIGGFLCVGVVEAVEVAGGFGFVGDVDEVGDGGLHAECHFVVLDGGFDFGVIVKLVGVALVLFFDEVELLALECGGVAGVDVGDGLF